MDDKSPRMSNVYTTSGDHADKTLWIRVGMAWRNKDGSYSLKLDALPINGKLLIEKPIEGGAEGPP